MIKHEKYFFTVLTWVITPNSIVTRLLWAYDNYTACFWSTVPNHQLKLLLLCHWQHAAYRSYSTLAVIYSVLHLLHCKLYPDIDWQMEHGRIWPQVSGTSYHWFLDKTQCNTNFVTRGKGDCSQSFIYGASNDLECS